MNWPQILVTLVTLICLSCLSEQPLAAAPTDNLVGHWPLDGDGKDASASHFDATPVGRVAYFDSPVGGKGQLLSLNGVDAHLKLDNAAAGNFDGSDFTVSLWVMPLDLHWAGLLQKIDHHQSWSLYTAPDGSIRSDAFSHDQRSPIVYTAAGAIEAGVWSHLTLVVQRSGATSAAHLYVDGVERAHGAAPAGPLDSPQPLLIGQGDGESSAFNGLIDDVRFYAAALTPEQIAALVDRGISWRRPKPWAAHPFDGKFEAMDNDVLVSLGEENTLRAGQLGFLEATLSAAAPSRRLFFRNMAWQGDTAFEQWRAINFGSWSHQLRRVGATTLLLQFGQSEALAGPSGIPSFIDAYRRLLDQLAPTTRRMVLLSPTPFEKPSGLLPDLSSHNNDLRLYVDAIHKLAAERGLLFVDLFSTLKAPDGRPLTRDGLHLTDVGQWLAAAETARQLGVTAPAANPADESAPDFADPSLRALRQQIALKNAWWFAYWRPGNWAFLYGDRVTQPSSRDHLDPRVRWFPAEVEQLPAMIDRQEQLIAQAVQARAAGKDKP